MKKLLLLITVFGFVASQDYFGDVNIDGQLNVLDVVAIIQMIINP